MRKLLAMGLLMICGAAYGQSATAVAKLDLARFSTTWYEIARDAVEGREEVRARWIAALRLG